MDRGGDEGKAERPRRRRPGTRTDFRRGAPAAARGRKEARGAWGGGGAVPPELPLGATGANSAIFECFKHITVSTAKIGGKELHTFPVKKMEREIQKKTARPYVFEPPPLICRFDGEKTNMATSQRVAAAKMNNHFKFRLAIGKN